MLNVKATIVAILMFVGMIGIAYAMVNYRTFGTLLTWFLVTIFFCTLVCITYQIVKTIIEG